MKRYFAILPAALLALSLAGCGAPAEKAPENPAAAPSVTAPVAPDAPATADVPSAPETPTASTATPSDFGEVTVQSGIVENSEKFTTFTDACAKGTAAKIRITQLTSEGAPIVTDLSFDGTTYSTTIDRSADATTVPSDQKPASATWKYLTPLSIDNGDGKPAMEWWLSSDAPATRDAADKLDYEGFYLLSLPVAVK